MSTYNKLAASAAKLLVKFGRDVVLVDVTLGTYNPATGTVAGGSSANVTRKGALFDFKDGQTTAAGGLIQTGDKKMLLDSSAPAPKVEDKVSLDGIKWAVKGVKEVNPGGTPVIYELHLRK